MLSIKQIRGLLLIGVYTILLTSLFLPHHHHEELTCYTVTHCEDDIAMHDRQAEDHSHDHTTSNESQDCLTTWYYIATDGVPGVKKLFVFEIPAYKHLHSLLICHDCKENQKLNLQGFVTIDQNLICTSYTSIIKSELPLRAPPALTA